MIQLCWLQAMLHLMDWNWLAVPFWFPIEHKLHWEFLNTETYSTLIWLSKINPFYERSISNSFYSQRGTEFAAWAACHSSHSLRADALPCSVSWWTAEKTISYHLCSKIIPTVGVNKSKEVCLFQTASCCSTDCPPKCQMETLLLDHSHGCQVCLSGGGFSKERTEEPGSGTAVIFCEKLFSLDLLGTGISTSIRYCHPDEHQLCCSAASCITCNRVLGKPDQQLLPPRKV